MPNSRLLLDPVPVLLDYTGASEIEKVLANLSGVVAADDRLWSISDEGRTVECLARQGAGYRLTRQLRLDDGFAGLPPGHEADLEGLDLDGDELWLCGAHCRVRLRPKQGGGAPVARKRDRPSRHLLGALPIDGGEGRALPFRGKGSLRRVLDDDPFLRDFMDLPSKENGLDIEGLAVTDGRLYLGLRGPVIDSHALILDIPLSKNRLPKLSRRRRHFLWLDGLGIRDLAADGDRLLVLAGPVTAVETPFRLHAWTPTAPGAAPCLGQWPEGRGKPEGICRLDRDGRRGLLVLFDAAAGRVDGATYRADWFALDG